MPGYQEGDAVDWEDSKLWMRVAQGAAVPIVVTDNPIEFGEVHAELERRRMKEGRKAATRAACLGILGSILGGVVGSLLTHFMV